MLVTVHFDLLGSILPEASQENVAPVPLPPPGSLSPSQGNATGKGTMHKPISEAKAKHASGRGVNVSGA